MTRFIFLPTIRHTGTFCIAAFLLDQPDVEGYLQLNSFDAKLVEEGTANHFVLDGTPGKGGKLFIREHITIDKINILQTHITIPFSAEKHMLMAILPTVIPLLDPLHSLISAQNRKENLDDLLSAWLTLPFIFNRIIKIKRPVVIPVDLSPTVFQFEKLLDFLPYVQKIDSWPTRYNNAEDYEAKTAYYNGDVKKLRELLGHYWEDLCATESVLRPFLELFRYKNLLWWD